MLDLKKKYTQEITKKMREKFGYANVMEVPKIEKIVLNRGIGDSESNPKSLELSLEVMAAISGQKPVVTRSKKSISNFKVREGQPIGCKVTLRSKRMYDFLTKLINVSLPKIRDFRGVPINSFDGRGNYTLGIKEDIIFPETNFDKIDKMRGFDITFVTSAKTNDEARELLTQFGMPFRRK
ncbi:MAG: 50S ribosomal protein L5 [Candidatus Margulisiibacteriota bacterium]